MTVTSELSPVYENMLMSAKQILLVVKLCNGYALTHNELESTRTRQ